MEEEAPILFHCAFLLTIVLSLWYLNVWKRRTGSHRNFSTLTYFLLLHIPAYGLLFFSVAYAESSSDRCHTFGLAGLIWATSIVVLMHAIKDFMMHDSQNKHKADQRVDSDTDFD